MKNVECRAAQGRGRNSTLFIYVSRIHSPVEFRITSAAAAAGPLPMSSSSLAAAARPASAHAARIVPAVSSPSTALSGRAFPRGPRGLSRRASVAASAALEESDVVASGGGGLVVDGVIIGDDTEVRADESPRFGPLFTSNQAMPRALCGRRISAPVLWKSGASGSMAYMLLGGSHPHRGCEVRTRAGFDTSLSLCLIH